MTDQRRGKNIAIAGAVLQVIFTAVLVGIFLIVHAPSALSCLVFLAGGLGVWLMVALLFYVRELEAREAKELEEIAAAAKAGTIFQDERVALRPAAARRAWTEKWVVPVFTFLWAGYQAAMGVWVGRWALGTVTETWAQPAPQLPGTAQAALFATLIAFVAFLFSRWCLGMAVAAPFRLLRAAGSYLFVNVLAIAAVAGAMLAIHQGYASIDRIVAVVIPAVQVILAAELLLNLLLDFYRPRVAGQEERLAFDSRLFDFIAEPGRIGHSIAEALNYQFGFEVSRTWFYQLLSRAFVPLVIVGAVVMGAMTSVVVVEQGQRVVVLHWGRADPSRQPLEAGIHFTWPWPIDTIRRFDVGAVHEILLGTGRERSEQERQNSLVRTGTFAGRELYLWTAEHGKREEKDFLLAIPPDRYRAAGGEQRPPVSIIKLVVLVHYVITDVYKYGFQVADAEMLLEDEAYRQMVRYCASATLDSPAGGGQSDRPEAIMTYGSGRAAEELQKRIQAAADKLDLGVKITYVGLSAVHPPAEAAKAFEDVLKAERQADGTRYQAEAEANRTLAQVAGDPVAALDLALAIRTLEELEALEHLQGKTDDYTRALAEYTQGAANDLASLDEELARERLLGQQVPAKQQLRREHQEHLALLQGLARDADKVDYSPLVAAARSRADTLFNQASGEPASLVAQAVNYRWTRAMAEQSRAAAFARELLAYQASPHIYMLDRWLDVWDEVLPDITKYVLGADRQKIEIWLNWERTPGVLEGALPQTPGQK